MDVQTPETPGRCSLRLDVYSPPQVLQIDGRLCHLVLAFLMLETLQMAGPPLAPLTLRRFVATTGRPQPPPSRLRPTSRFGRLYGLPCSGDFSPGRGSLPPRQGEQPRRS